MCLILLLASVHEEPANFYREKRRVAFVTGHFFTFLVVLSLICLATTQILICGNQTIWTLEILIRTTVAALFKTKDIKKRERNISQWCKWSWKMRVTNVLRLEQYLMPDYAHPAHPLPHKHSHTNKKDTVCPMTSAYPTSSPHNPFSNSHHDERASFLLTQLPKNKREFIHKSWKFT